MKQKIKVLAGILILVLASGIVSAVCSPLGSSCGSANKYCGCDGNQMSCSTHTCHNKISNGGACTQNYQCSSGVCDQNELVGSDCMVNFVGTETAIREPYIKLVGEIDGPTLKLLDVKELCSLSSFCVRAGGTWELTRQSDAPKPRRMAIKETGDCPSGRLVIQDKKTGTIIEPNFKPSISIVEEPQKNVSGPLWVKGGILIESSDGFEYEKRNRCTLCRCGKSSNKPFCDGTHISVGFKDGVESIK